MQVAIIVQVAIIGFKSWLQPLYFVLGLLVIGLASRLWACRYAARVGRT